jgi:hypothetical protein
MSYLVKPGFSTCYSIRKILLQSEDELKSILNQKTGFCFNTQETLEKLLRGIYLEETIEQLLQTLYADTTEISTKVEKLEVLVANHQRISVGSPHNYQELGDLKRQILWILGFKRVAVKIEDIVQALIQLNEYSINYIGRTLTVNTWKSTRPDFEWLNSFEFDRFGKITFAGKGTDLADAEQLNWIQEWILSYVYQVAQFIRDFTTTIEYKRIGELPEGVSITQMTSYSHWIAAKPRPAQI